MVEDVGDTQEKANGEEGYTLGKIHGQKDNAPTIYQSLRCSAWSHL